jgi:hypothetical protein
MPMKCSFAGGRDQGHLRCRDVRPQLSRMEARCSPIRDKVLFFLGMDDSQPTQATGPDAMRAAMADYVRAAHQAYLDAAQPLAPGDRARLPLLTAGEFTVAAVGTRYLHVLGTEEGLPAPVGPEVEIADSVGPLHWRLRFFDPVVAPGLGLIDETERPAPAQVRDVLGIRTVVYHLTVPPGGNLSAHHAQHAGTGLAHAHATAARDYDTLRSLGADPVLVAEMQGAEVAGLPHAVRALAALVAPGTAQADGPDAAAPDTAAVRRELIAALKAPRP